MAQVIRLRVVSAAAAGALTLGSLATVTTAQAATRTAIAGTHPTWATAAKRVSSRAVTTGTVDARVYLAPRDPSGLASYAQAVSDPGSAQYRKFLTPAEIAASYGPTSAEASAVRSWLASAGLAVTAVSSSGPAGAYIAVRGSTAAVAGAFGVTFGLYQGPDGQADRAPDQPATAPASVASYILGVSGLNTAKSVIRPALPPPPSNYWVAPPCSAYYGQKVATSEPTAYGKHQPWTNCGYTPRQISGAYGVTSSGMTGQGQTVAIVDAYASPTMLADANQYSTVVGEQKFAAGQYQQYQVGPYTQAGPNACDAQGWYGEETLDVEAVHGQAPGANVRYVAAASCQDPDLADADALIVNKHLASIVSNSWGGLSQDETLAAVYTAIFQYGAAEGVGFFYSSGDNGYEGPGEDPASSGDQVDFPAGSPWVTSVGGTSLAISKTNSYQFETAWGTMIDQLVTKNGQQQWQYPPPGPYPASYDGSGGGGVSTQYPQPAYQAGVVPDSLSENPPAEPTPIASYQRYRVIPDVSALGDPSTGFLIGETTLQPNGKTYAFSLSRIGGTSVACPVFAGIEADAQQAAGGPLGFANPVIYRAYRQDPAAFHDVTAIPNLAEVRNNYTDPATKKGPLLTYLRTLGINGEGADALRAAPGYDDATGVGSPSQYVQYFQH